MTKEQYFDDTSLSVKYSKTLKTLPLCLCEGIQLLMRVLLPRAIFATQLSSRAVIFHRNWRQCLKVNCNGKIFLLI